MALQEPLAVVAFDELADLMSGLLEAVEVVEVETLLLERADEPLHDTVGLSRRLHPKRWEEAEPSGRRILFIRCGAGSSS